MKTENHFEKIKQAVEATGNYSPGDDTLIGHAALILKLIDQAKADLNKSGLVQVFQNGTKNVAPELANLRGLLSDFRKYCDDLGLSPAAREKLGIKGPSTLKESPLRALRPGRQQAAGLPMPEGWEDFDI